MNLGLVLLSLVVVLIAAELILRLLPGKPPDSSPQSQAGLFVRCETDSLLGWIFPPDVTGDFPRASYLTFVETNPWGIRNREVDAADSTSTRILVLGDSYAFGWGVPDPDGFPRQIEQMLRGLHPPRPVEVINASIPGYGLYQQCRMLAYIQARVRVDIVISTFSSANDPIDDLRIARYMPDRLARYSSDLRNPGSLISQTIRRTRLLTLLDNRTRSMQFSVANTSPAALAEARHSLEGLVTTCDKAGVRLLMAIAPRRSEVAGGRLKKWIARRWMKKARQVPLDIAHAHEIPVVDLRDILIAVEDDGGAYLEGDVHWSPAGNRAVAAAILDALPEEWLK
jgi:lysophospholipase L1-like esterase